MNYQKTAAAPREAPLDTKPSGDSSDNTKAVEQLQLTLCWWEVKWWNQL